MRDLMTMGNYPRLLSHKGWFDNIFGDSFWDEKNTIGTPNIDITKTDGEYNVKADLPGMTEKDVNVKVENGYLTIEGKKEKKDETNGENVYTERRSYSSFRRSLKISDDFNTEKIDAKMKNGVLSIKLPLAEEKKTRQIEVQVR